MPALEFEEGLEYTQHLYRKVRYLLIKTKNTLPIANWTIPLQALEGRNSPFTVQLGLVDADDRGVDQSEELVAASRQHFADASKDKIDGEPSDQKNSTASEVSILASGVNETSTSPPTTSTPQRISFIKITY